MSFIIDPPMLFLSGIIIFLAGLRFEWNRHAKIVVGIAITSIFMIFSWLLYADIIRCAFPLFNGMKSSEFMLHTNYTGLTKANTPPIVIMALFLMYPLWIFAGYALALLSSKRKRVSKDLHSYEHIRSALNKSGSSIYAVARDPDPKKSLRTAVDSIGGIQKFVKKGDRVLIKVNICGGIPEINGTFTSTEVVDELVDLVKSVGAEPLIADADMIWTKFVQAAHDSGWTRWARDRGVKLINLSETAIVQFDFGNESSIGIEKVSKELIDADAIISVPVMKTHLLTGVTLGMKNMYGTLPEIDKAKFHRKSIEDVIYEINLAFKPNLTIIDGSIGGESIGPLSCNPLNFQTIVASNDVVTADAVACQLMGYDPMDITHIKLAHERGLGDASARFDLKNLSYRHVNGKDGNWERPSKEVKDFSEWGIETLLKIPGWKILFDVGADFFLYDLARLPLFRYLTPAFLRTMHDIVYLNLRSLENSPDDNERRKTNVLIVLLVAFASIFGFYSEGYFWHSTLPFDLGYLTAIGLSVIAAARMRTDHLIALISATALVSAMVKQMNTSADLLKYTASPDISLFIVSEWILLMLVILYLSDLLTNWFDGLGIFRRLRRWNCLPFALALGSFFMFMTWEGYPAILTKNVLMMYALMAVLGLIYSSRHSIEWNTSLLMASLAIGGYMELMGSLEGLWLYHFMERLAIFIVLSWPLNCWTIHCLVYLLGMDLGDSKERHLFRSAWSATLMSSTHLEPTMPVPFMFGVATADHQCEAYKKDCEDIRDVWEREKMLVTRGRATDFEKRYYEDIELARKLGCKTFRFSIAWSRVEPMPNHFDESIFDYYRSLIRAIRSAGMEPILTLHHFTWPVHVQNRGGMIADDFPEIYAHYVAEVVKRFGLDVRYWITFNEPNQLIFGYIRPWWLKDYSAPPGLPPTAGWDVQIEAVGKLMRNLFISHSKAYGIIKSVNPDAQVSANPLLYGLPIWLQRLINWNATRITIRDLEKQAKRIAQHHPFDRGKVDMVIANISKTLALERQLMLSEVYFVAGLQLLSKSTSIYSKTEDFDRKKIAVVRGTTAKQNIPILLPRSKVFVTKDYAAAMQQLDQGLVDALLADDTILRSMMVQYPRRYKLIGKPLTTGTEQYVVAVTQGNRDLLDLINQVIRRFKNSCESTVCCNHHFGLSFSAIPADFGKDSAFEGPEPIFETRAWRKLQSRPMRLAPKGTALRRIQERDYLIAAVKSDVVGFSFRNPENDELGGLENNLARSVAKCIFGDEDKVCFRPITSRERMQLLSSPLRYLDSLFKTYSILSSIFVSNWWHLGMAGKLPEFICPLECRNKQDFVGLDYYWGIRTLQLNRIQALMEAGLGRFDKAPVWPEALYDHLHYYSKLFPDMPLVVTENGSVDEADNIDRSTYIRRHIEQVNRAARKGVNVIGYVYWAVTSNREWGLPFDKSNDFGLYHIELDADPQLKRIEIPAAKTYQDLIATS